MKILPAADVRAWEAAAIAAGQATEAGLMEAAVQGCVRQLVSTRGAPRRLLVLAGRGNNGNDGLLLAARMRARGWTVRCLLADPPFQRRGCIPPDAAAEAAVAEVWTGRLELESAARWTVVDALLGSGAGGAPRGAVREMLEAVEALPAEAGHWRVAVDIPSGLDPETGAAAPHAFRADVTWAIGALKPGCLRDAARPWVGRIAAVPLPLPDPVRGADFLLPAETARSIRPLPAGIHKHRRGHVAVWAGSPGMAGAAILAARAALRAGAGLVRVWSHPDVLSTVVAAVPEAMTGELVPGNPLPEELRRAGVLLAGPGLGRSAEAADLLGRVVRETSVPLVLDADALVLAAADSTLLPAQPERFWVATPHQGELARFLADPPAEREEAVRTLCRRHPGSVWVAKGPNSLVAHNDTITWNGSGNPGMASAGMGDVLAGLLAGLMARQGATVETVRLGVAWHGLAADLAARHLAELLLNAGDVLDALPRAWRWMEARSARDPEAGP